MRLSIHHRSSYRYREPVRENTNELRLLPRQLPRQRITREELRLRPEVPVFHSVDYWGNRVAHFNVLGPHQELLIESWVEVETLPGPRLDEGTVPFPEVSVAYDLREFLLSTRLTSPPQEMGAVGEAVAALRRGSPDLICFLDGLAAHLKQTLHYEQGVTTVESTVADVLRQGGGVCQDFSHLFISLCRSVGIPCRYAGGYHYLGATADRHESHAWAEVYLPGIGWMGWDPVNGCRVGEAHVQVTAGRDYADVSPVRGSYKGPPGVELEVELHMKELPDA